MISRRRFLAISAAAAATPVGAASARWQGQALGADASIELHGMDPSVLDQVPAILDEVEAEFSLYRADSAVSRLNRDGRLAPVPAWFADMLGLCDHIHRLTEGRFDPSVQSLWHAYALGQDPHQAQVGWDRVRIGPEAVDLAPGLALTFNGIAQGYATDLVAAYLKAQGADRVLVNIGEYRGWGGGWKLGLYDPGLGLYGWYTLDAGAVATSSPGALRLSAERWHILDPQDRSQPQWSSVTVEANTAALADGLSTAFCLADRAQIDAMASRVPGLRRVQLVGLEGDVIRL